MLSPMQTHPFWRTVFFGGLAALLTAAVAHAQSGGGSPVRVEFRATNALGQPVTDLKGADVSLKLDGKAREIRALQFVAAGDGAAAPGPSAPAFATNVASHARTIVLVLDEESIAPGKEQPLKDALLKFLDHLSAGDRVGMLSVRRGAAAIAPTSNHETLKKAITELSGQARTESTNDFQCRTAVTLQALREMLTGPIATPRTTFLFISAGMSPPPPPVRVGQSSGLCQLEPRQLEEVGTAAATSPSSIFVAYYVDGMASPTSESASGVENVAGVAQTTLIRVSGSNADAFSRVAAATSGLYVASFDDEPGERNGAAHRLELRVARDGVHVRAPSSIVLPKRDKPASPRDMLRVPTAYMDLPIRAVAMSSRNPGDDKIKVITLVEAAEPGTKLSGLAIGFIDEKNKLTAQWTAQESDLSRPLLMAAVTVAPGTYRMRVAAVDANGRAGAADADVRVGLAAAGPLKLSTPMLGLSEGGNFSPRLQFTKADGAALGYVEIYGVPANANVSVLLELARTDEGPAMANATTQVGGKDDMRVAYGGFDISRLEPGDYVLRAIVSLDGKPVGQTLRTLRKTN
jgi:hypothetical protein